MIILLFTSRFAPTKNIYNFRNDLHVYKVCGFRKYFVLNGSDVRYPKFRKCQYSDVV